MAVEEKGGKLNGVESRYAEKRILMRHAFMKMWYSISLNEAGRENNISLTIAIGGNLEAL